MAAGSNHAPSKLLVIVVDDDAAVRDSLKFSLETEGFRVRAFSSGAELLESSQNEVPSCLVIDQNMPGIAGLELIEMMRARHAGAPAILITGHPSGALKRRAESASIPIVEKPLLGTLLVDVIRHSIAAAAQRR